MDLYSEHVSGNSIDLAWSGVPNPQQKYVNLYRVLYVEDDKNSIETQSVFKVAKFDSMKAMRIKRLKLDTRYVCNQPLKIQRFKNYISND